MKNKAMSKSVFSIMLSVTTVICSFMFAPSVNAGSGEKCTVNDMEFSKGDVITYTLEINEAAEKFCGIDISVYYDPDCLSVDAQKISLPIFQNAVFSNDMVGEIRFNAIDVVNGFDFTNGGTVISAAFKINENAKDSTNVTFSIRELYGMDLDNPENLTDYKTSVTIVKGEESDDKIVKPKNIDEIEEVLLTQYGDLPGNNEDSIPVVWIIIAGAAAGVVAAIIVTILIKKRNCKK